MAFQFLLPNIITALVAIMGWLIGHLLLTLRDRANKRRDMRIASLVDAFLQLSNCVELRDRNLLYQRAHDLESAIAKINIFGTASQIAAADTFIKEIVSTKSGNILTLLELLRNDLREDLKLPRVDTILWIRVSKPEENAT